jgi:hypothetical protein
LQDSFGGYDARGARVGRGGGHEGLSFGRRSRLRQGRAALELGMAAMKG